jgi:hypothetical protein
MQGANCDSIAKRSETGTELRGARSALGLLGARRRLPLWLWHHKRIRIDTAVHGLEAHGLRASTHAGSELGNCAYVEVGFAQLPFRGLAI